MVCTAFNVFKGYSSFKIKHNKNKYLNTAIQTNKITVGSEMKMLVFFVKIMQKIE